MIHKVKSGYLQIAGFVALEACLFIVIGIAVSGAGAPTLFSDAEFAKKAAQGGVLEVKLGQLAQQKAESEAVREFGKRMENDHSKAGDNLKQVASLEQLPLPTDLDKMGQMEYDKLSKLSGADFDLAYTKMMVQDHQKDVAEFQKEVRSGQDEGIRNFAAQTLPAIQEHLQLIQKIQKDLTSSRNSAGI
jgi:putative membrane protein